MNKNKSIDGLKPKSQHPKKVVANKKKPTTPKAATKKAIKPAIKKTPVKKKIVIESPVPETPINTEPFQPETLEANAETDTTNDFLQPVQAFNFDETSGELKEMNAMETKKIKKKQKHEKVKSSKKRKVIVSIIIILLLILIGAGVCFILWGNDIIAKITGGQGNILDLIFQDETYEPLKADEKGRTNILAFGTSGYNMEGDEGNGKHDGAQLTDSIMIISLDQNTGDVVMLSLPRDLKASPTCTATGKINEVYWCNNMYGDNEQAGAEALMKEVGSILGLDFQYYAHLNWGSLISIVDTLGGIQVTLDEDILDYNYTGAVYEAGVEYTINGAEAMGLSRARHGTANGDFSRGASQQKILIGIKNKVLEKGLSITDIISLASTLGDNLRTNFSIDEMKTLAHLTYDFDFDNVRQISLLEPTRLMTTGTINNISYVLPSAGQGNYYNIRNYIAKTFSSNPLDYEDYSILILNATEEYGLASAEQSNLEEAGYTNIDVDNITSDEITEQYTLYFLSDSAPGTKKLLETKYNTTAKSAEELPEGVSRDYDFVIIVNNS